MKIDKLSTIINPILKKYSLESKEILEVCQIGKFLSRIDSNIKIIDKPKPPNPDFTIEIDEKIIGLEHTRILSDDLRHRKIVTLLEKAEKIFEDKYPNINVHAIISILNDKWEYYQKDKRKIAEEIADSVQ